MATDVTALFAYPYSHPSLIREHRVVLRLFMMILMSRGVPEEQARQEADSLLRPLPPGREFGASACSSAKAG